MIQISKCAGKYKLQQRMERKPWAKLLKHGKQGKCRISIALIKLKVPPLNKLDAEIYIYIYKIYAYNFMNN